jgi:hypothetical protein
LTRPEKEAKENEEEGAEDKKVTFVDAVNGLAAARKCVCEFEVENNINVVCNKVEYKPYRLRTQGKKKTMTIIY